LPEPTSDKVVMTYMRAICRAIIPLFFLSLPVQAADMVYPVSSQATVDYSLSNQTPAAGELITITRILKNNESFPLTGIYFSENLPPDIVIESYSLTVNGTAGSAEFMGPFADEIEVGYQCYRWLVDSPDPLSPFQVTLNPGDSVVLATTVTCSTEGDYQLPFHTVSFYGNGEGCFATASPQTVSVGPPPDTIPPSAITDLSVE
ncbi:MAG: hypothetical protein P1R58_12655, partial [bacterium]|nr:hypothetical protein [bacterium]